MTDDSCHHRQLVDGPEDPPRQWTTSCCATWRRPAVSPNIKNAEINGNERYGISVFTNTGLCLFLGFDNYENKFKRLSPVLADLERRNIKTGHLYIDLSDPVKITVQQRGVLPPATAANTKKGFKT